MHLPIKKHVLMQNKKSNFSHFICLTHHLPARFRGKKNNKFNFSFVFTYLHTKKICFNAKTNSELFSLFVFDGFDHIVFDSLPAYTLGIYKAIFLCLSVRMSTFTTFLKIIILLKPLRLGA